MHPTWWAAQQNYVYIFKFQLQKERKYINMTGMLKYNECNCMMRTQTVSHDPTPWKKYCCVLLLQMQSHMCEIFVSVMICYEEGIFH